MHRSNLFSVFVLLLTASTSLAQSPPAWTWRHPAPDWSRWNGFSVADSVLYLHGDGAISLSHDAVNWTRTPTSPHIKIVSIAQSPTEYIALGSIGHEPHLFRSTDGTNFTTAARAPFAKEIVFAHGRYYLNNSPLQSVSPDLTSWSTHSTPGVWYNDILPFGDTLVVAVNPSSPAQPSSESFKFIAANKLASFNGVLAAITPRKVSYTTNLVNWHHNSCDLPDFISGAAFGPNGLLVLGQETTTSAPLVFFSPDQRNWFSFVNTPETTRFVTYHQGRYLLAGEAGLISTSSDGFSWTVPDESPYLDLPNLTVSASNGKTIVALGQSGLRPAAMGYYSTNAVNWRPVRYSPPRVDWGSPHHHPPPIDDTPPPTKFNSLVFAYDRFIAVGDKGEAWISYEGSAWRRSDSHVTSDLLSLTYSPLGFVAVGRGPVLLSGNGVNWKTVSHLSESRYSIAYGNGKFIVTGSPRWVDPIYSTNLIDWAALKGLGGYHVAFGNDRFVMVTTTGIQTSTNGLDWMITRQGNSSAPVHFSDGYFLIGTLASQDGITWHELPRTLPSLRTQQSSKPLQPSAHSFSMVTPRD